MKKIIKIVFLFFILFSFNGVAYASNQCFYMPGKNNAMIVPKGYSARCYYKYDSTQSKNNKRNNNYLIEVNFSLSGITMSEANNTFLSMANNFHPSQVNGSSFDWDGLTLDNNNREISVVVYDDSINGCPKSIYWVDNPTKVERYVGFSSNRTPTITTSSSATYAVYTQWTEEDTGRVDFISDNEGVNDIWSIYGYFDDYQELHNQAISNCGNNIAKNENTGYGEPSQGSNDIVKETLKSCSYFFELDDYQGKCYSQQIAFTYIKTTQAGQSTLSVSTTDSGLTLNNINDKISSVNLADSSTYINLSDYLLYKNGTWTCADKIYVCKDPQCSNAVFGASQYNSFKNMYGQDQIVESSKSNQNLCPPSDSNSGSSIDWGNGVEKNCQGIIGQDLLDFINKIFRWIQILAPIFVIIMGAVDFTSAILQDDKDSLKKASNKLLKRLIIAVALFFIPLILSFLLNVFNDVTGGNADTCNIGVSQNE